MNVETNQRSSLETCSFNRRRKKPSHAQKSRLKQSGGSFPERLPPQCAGADIHVAKRESSERRRWAVRWLKCRSISAVAVLFNGGSTEKKRAGPQGCRLAGTGEGEGGGNEQGTINVQRVHNTFSQTARCELHTCCLSLPRRRHVCTRVRITCLT